jgi:citronellol/citronellal dehydrogenase
MRMHDATMVMSGGSRGIGLAIAVAAARQGANIVLLAKTDQPDPRLPGTIYTAAEAITAAGGQALPLVGDVRREEDVARAAAAAVERFGGVDIVINNASAIDLRGTAELTTKRFDLMQQVNVRGTYLFTKACLPALRGSSDARVITLSPPLNLNPRWLGSHPAYTLSKYAMTLLTLGWAEEFSTAGIACTCLWPETLIATAAVHNVVGGSEAARHPDIMADAAMVLLSAPGAESTGKALLDTDVLAAVGRTDLSRYGGGPQPARDIFVDAPPPRNRLYPVHQALRRT